MHMSRVIYFNKKCYTNNGTYMYMFVVDSYSWGIFIPVWRDRFQSCARMAYKNNES